MENAEDICVVCPTNNIDTNHCFDSVFNNIDRCGTTHQDFSCVPAFSLGAVDEHLTPGNGVDGIAGVATGVGVGGASNR